MLKAIIRGVFLLTVLFNFLHAQEEHNSKDIIDVVDFKIQRVKNNLENKLHEINMEINELKKVKSDDPVTQKIADIDKSLKILNDTIIQISHENKSLQKKLAKYDTEKLQSDNSVKSVKVWIISFSIIVLAIAYFMIYIFVKKAKEEMNIKMEKVLEKNMQKHKDELSAKVETSLDTKALIDKVELELVNFLNGDKNMQQIKNKFELLRDEYKNREITKELLINQLQVWAKTIEEKKTRKKVGNFLEEFES